MDTAAISAESLTRRFGSAIAVDAVTFTVASGSVFGLLGPNGAGKSSTIKMLTTLLPPTSGSARVAGFDVVRQPYEVRRRIGYVPQLPSADGDLTGMENLKIFVELYGVPRAERKDRIDEALALMDLADAADTLVSHYSGGMVRRLEIAESMLHRPAVLFLDEPTIGLDPAARRTVWEHVRSLRERFSTTIFLTTHYMEEAEELCDTVAFMRRGKIALLGPPAQLRTAIGPEATLEDVFIELAEEPPTGDDAAHASRTRVTNVSR
ncbi:MAG TPA: ATP-binding cassette domain-containing protein [Candidatus Dormibacteraeota bacterium]|nr:ATP-binding cassette domain-containing protein [Candidatus Dormibacteraeota bacterium]